MTLWNTYLVDCNMNLLEQRKKFGFDAFPSPRDISYNCIYADYARCPAERSNSDGSKQTMRRPLFLPVPCNPNLDCKRLRCFFRLSSCCRNIDTRTTIERANLAPPLQMSRMLPPSNPALSPRPARLGMRQRESRGSYKRLPMKFERNFSCSCMTLHFTVLNHLII